MELVPLPESSDDEPPHVATHIVDSSSDSEGMSTSTVDATLFGKGSVTKGDVNTFADTMLRHLRGGRATEYTLARQAQIWSLKGSKP